MIGAVTQEAIEASNCKAYNHRGASPGPGPESVPVPGEVPVEDYDRPYLTDGEAADSPGNAGVPRHVRFDWRAGVAGEGPVAGRVRLWPAGPQPVAQLPGGEC